MNPKPMNPVAESSKPKRFIVHSSKSEENTDESTKTDSQAKNYNWVGVYLLLFLLILIGICIVTYLSFPLIPGITNSKDQMLRALIYVGSAGGIGGLFYGMNGFYTRMKEETFDDKLVWWYVFRPFLSITLGVIVYFLLLGGLLFTTSKAPAPENYSVTIMFYSGISFLVGFSIKQVIDKLKELTETLFAVNNPEKPTNGEPSTTDSSTTDSSTKKQE